MGAVDRRCELFEAIARLRRVGHELPGNEDLACVRLMLERELGSTVSLRLAARLLDVSHTALQRWVIAGDVPVVFTPAGSRAVPLPALLDLYDETREGGLRRPARYALAPTMRRRREAAREMHVDVSVEAPFGDDGHERALERSLAYHKAVAQRLDMTKVAEARYVLFRWREEGRIDPRYADAWQEVLAKPLSHIRRAITAGGSGADDLRQNSPFAGTLSEPERRRILAEVV